MEQLREIPPEVAKYNPAYKHLTMWLTEEGISTQLVSELAFQSYSFQTAAVEILKSPDVGIGITGKGHEHKVSTTLRFRLVWPGFVTPAEEIRPELERVLSETFAGEVGKVAADAVHVELNFVDDLPVTEEDHHIGYIGLTKEGAEELSRMLRAGPSDPEIASSDKSSPQ